MLSRIRSLFTTLLRRQAFESEMEDELRLHLESRVDDLVRSGLSREDAARRAAVEFGGVEKYKERCRQSRGLHWIDDLISDFLFFLRSLRRNALLSVAVVLTLTLAIGMDTGIFAMINASALRPLVEKDPGTYLMVFSEYSSGTRRGAPGPATFSDYIAFRQGTRSLQDLAAWSMTGAVLGRDDGSVQVVLATCNFFSVQGADQPKLGRLFVPEDCLTKGAAPVVVLSEEVWRNRFGSNPAVVGTAIQLNDQIFTIAGVAPAGSPAKLNRTVIVWAPYTMQPMLGQTDLFGKSETPWLSLGGRLRPGFTHRDAETELGVIAAQQDRLHPGRRDTLTVTDGSWFQEPTFGRVLRRWVVPLIVGTLTLVLLLACANVTTLLLSRAAARQHEIAVRLALGASRSRLLRMLLTETVLLAVLSSVCSLWLAYRIPVVLYRFLSQEQNLRFTPDWRVFAYISAAALLAGCASGFAPALESLRGDVAASLRGIGSLFGDTVKSGSRLRNGLVAAQIAMSLVLLAGAGVFVRAYQQIVTASPGFDTRQTLFVRMFPRGRAPARASWSAFHSLIAQRVEALPGVRSVAFSQTPLVLGPSPLTVQLPGQQPHELLVNAASPGFFETVGIRIVAGRDFTAKDSDVAVISETCGRMLWPGESPIGKTLDTPGGRLQVIGVARDIHDYGSSFGPLIYPIWSGAARPYPMVVRFSGDAQAIERAVSVALREAAPEMSALPQTIQGWIDMQVTGFGRIMTLMLILGGVALALATTGIYGVVAFAATRRTKELGIRIALGASRRDIIAEMLLSGAKPIAGGLLVGLLMTLAASVVLSRTIARSPIAVDTRDPMAYGAVMLLLASAAVVAILIPARRAANADPLQSLRQE